MYYEPKLDINKPQDFTQNVKIKDENAKLQIKIQKSLNFSLSF